jgi:hypothetical protein
MFEQMRAISAICFIIITLLSFNCSSLYSRRDKIKDKNPIIYKWRISDIEDSSGTHYFKDRLQFDLQFIQKRKSKINGEYCSSGLMYISDSNPNSNDLYSFYYIKTAMYFIKFGYVLKLSTYL